MPAHTMLLAAALCLGLCAHSVQSRTVADGMLVRCTTTTGDIVIKMTPERGPLGAQRFIDLVDGGFFSEVPLFRVVKGFLVQYGIPGKTKERDTYRKWTDHAVKDDPHPASGRSTLRRGDMSFAGAGPNSRTTQVFITYADRNGLGGALHETPFGTVIEGMESVDAFYGGYGDIHPFGKHGPDNGKLWAEGNEYVHREFPKMDFMKSCAVMAPETSTPAEAKAGKEELVQEEHHAETRHGGGNVAHAAAGGTPTTHRPSVLPFALILLTLLAVCWANSMSRDDKKGKD